MLASSKPSKYLTFIHKTRHKDDHRGTQLHFTGGKAKAIRAPLAPQSLGKKRDQARAAGSRLGVM